MKIVLLTHLSFDAFVHGVHGWTYDTLVDIDCLLYVMTFCQSFVMS